MIDQYILQKQKIQIIWKKKDIYREKEIYIYIYIHIYIYSIPKKVPRPPRHPRLGTNKLPRGQN